MFYYRLQCNKFSYFVRYGVWNALSAYNVMEPNFYETCIFQCLHLISFIRNLFLESKMNISFPSSKLINSILRAKMEVTCHFWFCVENLILVNKLWIGKYCFGPAFFLFLFCCSVSNLTIVGKPSWWVYLVNIFNIDFCAKVRTTLSCKITYVACNLLNCCFWPTQVK